MNVPEKPFDLAKASVVGDRSGNQDRCVVLYTGDTVVLCLADGLGGHPRGEVAAQLLVDVCESMFRQVPVPLADPEQFILQVIGKAHHAIVRFGRRQNPQIAPRTTAVIAVIQRGVAHWAHVGDSRLYLLRDQQIHAQTRDHALIRFVRQSASETSRPRSSLTRCLGGVPQPPTTTYGIPTPLQPGDTILLCSDGLWGQVSTQALVQSVSDSSVTLADGLNGIVGEAVKAPRSDNVSAVALRWRGFRTQVDEAQADAETDDAPPQATQSSS
ncbi:PP2C family protein-serine/threonine phosphatase [Thiosocius teredinicola]|uniref:PP2C family protein-serine/threonine phosphatase n=1 Tax=Thiosocius teredinicola TaxID=1973002 RepID=UPI000990EDBB